MKFPFCLRRFGALLLTLTLALPIPCAALREPQEDAIPAQIAQRLVGLEETPTLQILRRVTESFGQQRRVAIPHVTLQRRETTIRLFAHLLQVLSKTAPPDGIRIAKINSRATSFRAQWTDAVEGEIRADMRFRDAPAARFVWSFSKNATPGKEPLGQVRVGIDHADGPLQIHADFTDPATGGTLWNSSSWLSHLDLNSAFTDSTGATDRQAAFSSFQEKLLETIDKSLIQIAPRRTAVGAGLEETAQAAQFLRRYWRERPWFDEDSDESWVRQFVRFLGIQPRSHVVKDHWPVNPKEIGSFTRDDMVGPFAEEDLHDELLPALRITLTGIASQLNATHPERLITIEDLGLEPLERFLSALYHARDPQGNLYMGAVREGVFYRWAYRDIPRRFVPHLVWIPRRQRGLLHQALENPLRLTNDQGNDAMQRAIAELLTSNPAFTDRPEYLRQDPKRLIPWILLTLAANLVDYSRDSILREISEGGDLARYVVERMNTPFLESLGGERYLHQFVNRVTQSAQPLLLVFLPDNNVELAASLKLAEVLLSANPMLRIQTILKADNGAMNDGSVADGRRLLTPRDGVQDIYERLRQYEAQGRFQIIPGAASHGTPMELLPAPALWAIEDADLIFSEGEANLGSLNGLAKEIYFGLRLKWPMGVRHLFGLDLSDEIRQQRPPAFFRVDGERGRYFSNPFGVPGRGESLTIRQFLEQQEAGLEEIHSLEMEPLFKLSPQFEQNRHDDLLLADQV